MTVSRAFRLERTGIIGSVRHHIDGVTSQETGEMVVFERGGCSYYERASIHLFFAKR